MNDIKIGDYVIVNLHNGINDRVGRVLGIHEDYDINILVRFREPAYKVYYFAPNELMMVNKKDDPEYFI
jgi:hypothetical protein